MVQGSRVRPQTSVGIDCEVTSTGFPLLIQEGLLSVIRESICRKNWLTTKSSLPKKKSVVTM